MPSATRKRVAELGFISLNVLGLLVFGTMLVQQLITQQSPTPHWQIPFGGVLVLLGIHSTYVRTELAEIARSTKRTVLSLLFFASLAGQYSPWMFLLGGLGLTCIGSVLLLGGPAAR